MRPGAIRAGPVRWVQRESITLADPDRAHSLASALGLPLPLCRLLLLRGLAAPQDAKRFLRPRLTQLHDPWLMPDCERAVARIRAAIQRGETILVHGDYDVDGVCAAALLTRTLSRLGAHVHAFVPHRVRDGYDLGSAGLAAATRVGARLLITADCGILAHDTVREARRCGVDVIITDHHTPGATLPDALAVLNPGRADSSYPERSLAGTGVAFKLCEALYAAANRATEELLYELDLVALATIADLVPLHGENRVFARFGLRVLAQTRNQGVRALIQETGLSERAVIGATHVSHVLAPRLNAAGRLEDADWALRLLLAERAEEAAELAVRLESTNRERRAVDRETLAAARQMLEASFDPARDFGIVLAGDGWHPGVIGIVASRIVELVHRPTILIARGTAEHARGSGRGIRGFDLLAAIQECGSLLERYGGHRQAAGLEIRVDRIDAFREAFAAAAAAQLDRRPEAELEWDVEIALNEATPQVCSVMRHFGPFGMANPTPVFVARHVEVRGPPRAVGRDREHLRLRLGQNGTQLGAIGFGMAERLAAQPTLLERPIDVAFTLHEDRWNGRAGAQARLLDVRPAEPA
ncbi:MAG: single-stranded-DNA-specific exonuclease RecJ [Longimicrobiales bacterium]